MKKIKMTQQVWVRTEVKAGDTVIVSWKGDRKGTFKNLRYAEIYKKTVAYVEFDNGDGTGRRLHRVLATTLKPMPNSGIELITPEQMREIESARESQARYESAKTQRAEPAKKVAERRPQQVSLKDLSGDQLLALAKAGLLEFTK